MPPKLIAQMCKTHPGNLTAPIKRACSLVQWLGDPPGPGVLTMGIPREAIGRLLAARGPVPLLQLSVGKDLIPRVYAAKLLGFSRAMLRDILVAEVPVVAVAADAWLRPHVLAVEEHVANGDRTLALEILHQCP